MGFSQFDERIIQVQMGNWTFGTSPGALSPITGSAFGTRVDQLIFTWNGAAPTTVYVLVDDGFGDNGAIGSVTLAAPASGELTTVDAMAVLLPAASPYILLGPGGHISMQVTDTYLGTDMLTYYLSGGNF